VLTTQVAAAAPPADKRTGAVQEADETFKVFQVINGSAPALANVINGVLQRKDLRISVDERTNTLIMRGSSDQLDVARAIIARLDIPMKP